MPGLAKKPDLAARMARDVTSYLYDAFSADSDTLGGLDRWTQRRVTDENMAKLSLVLEAEDAVEHCYQDLIREIDSEAECGIYLASRRGQSTLLRELAEDPGISGRLAREMHTIAPIIFADESEHSDAGLDLVWVTIQARYARALIDAKVSEIIMRHVSDYDDAVIDMSMALRSLLYSFHEDLVRRRSGLPLILNERATRELMSMIADLSERGGNYEDRVAAICFRAGTA